MPDYDPGGNTAVYVWRDCPANTWQVRATSGSGWASFTGSVTTTTAFAAVDGVGLEGADTLDVTDAASIDYRLGVSSPWEDGFEFALPEAASACFLLVAPQNATLRLGVNQTLSVREFDTGTLAGCRSDVTTLAVDDVAVREDDGTAAFIVRASGGSGGPATVDYRTVAATAAAGADYVENAGTLVLPDGADSEAVAIDLIDDSEPEGVERFNLELSNADNAVLTDSVGVATITDDDVAPGCGAPAYDFAVDRHVVLWKDCVDNTWRLRAGAGGGSFLSYRGTVESTTPLAIVAPVELEANDTLSQSAPGQIDFTLGVVDRWTDGFDFSATMDAGTCFDLSLPASAIVLVGPGRLPLEPPFDLATLSQCGADQPDDDRYNVVVVFTDDQRFDTLRHMPNVNERLLPRGVNFENAYVPTPLCCPARASTLSGGYLAQNTGVLDNGAPNGGVDRFDDHVNLGTRLQGSGYETLFIGKWLNDYVRISPYVPPGWDTFIGRAVYATSTDWSAFRYAVGSSGADANVGSEVGTAGQYHPYWERDRIVEFVEEVPTNRPFFVFWSTTAPHASATPDAMDDNAFASFVYRDRGFGESDLSDKPAWVRNYTPGISLVGDEAVRDQLRTMLAVDRGLGSILDAITARGQLDRTLFIVTSDNGYMWGEHGLWGKNKAYEEALRVPLLVVMPGIEPRNEDKLASAVLDLGPTIYEVAGLDAAGDGRSLVPLLENPAADWRDELFFEKFSNPRYPNAVWAALRNAQWKYVKYWYGDEELYDLIADPYELENRAGDPALAAVQAALQTRLDEQLGLAIIPDYATPAGQVGQPYQFGFETWGGDAPFTWTLASGTLPPGLTLDAQTGVIAGQPRAAGSETFTVRVTDSTIVSQAQRLRTYVSAPVTINVQ